MSSRKRDYEEQLPEELKQLERSLASFEPKPSRIDRDRLMFVSGAASGLAKPFTDSGDFTGSCLAASGPISERKRLLPFTAAAAALIACVFASLYALERNRAPVTVREVVYVETETPTASGGRKPSEFVHNQPASHITDRDAENQPAYADRSPFVMHRPFFLPDFRPLTSDPSQNYLALRQLVLTRGVESLPQWTYTNDSPVSGRREPAGASKPATIRSLMEELLPPRTTKVSANAQPIEPTTFELGETI